jgi:hypothetical protein
MMHEQLWLNISAYRKFNDRTLTGINTLLKKDSG